MVTQQEDICLGQFPPSLDLRAASNNQLVYSGSLMMRDENNSEQNEKKSLFIWNKFGGSCYDHFHIPRLMHTHLS